MKLQLNQPAPNFKLYNTEKKEISLSDYQGKNRVLLFFPVAFSSTCTAELCATRDDIAYYNSMNAVVIGISNDSVFALKKFKEEQNINFDLLSDFNKTVSEDYGTLYEEFILGMKHVTKRSAFVMDKNGNLQYIEILEDGSKIPNFDAIKEKLSQLK